MRRTCRTFYRLSSGAERQAHNLEVVGSKPTGGSNPIRVFLPLYRSGTSSHRHKHFKPLPRRTFYRLTPTLLMTHHHRSDSRMVIFLFITRTVWDRYLQVAFVKLDAINAAQCDAMRRTCRVFYRCGAEEARGAHNSEDT